jgi:2-oxoglutarate dehydrogenase E2 component (dihydrolipoamide succinyltransferase)
VATDVEVPALGESITEGTLAQWLKKPGEAVAADEPIASLETDKVSVEVPSPVAGVLTEQLVGEGDTVAVGSVIARIDQSATASPARRPILLVPEKRRRCVRTPS